MLHLPCIFNHCFNFFLYLLFSIISIYLGFLYKNSVLEKQNKNNMKSWFGSDNQDLIPGCILPNKTRGLECNIQFLAIKLSCYIHLLFRCLKFNLCFAWGGKYQAFLKRDTDICHPKCPAPINPDDLEKHCKRSLFRAMKVNYMCRLEWLLPLLSADDVIVKIVHLVRDPRATAASHIAAWGESYRSHLLLIIHI